MCEVPTVEVTVPVGFVWVDILHRGLGERCNWVRGTPSGPCTGGGVGGAIGERGQRGLGRRRDCMAVMCAFLSLSAATFAFVEFAFAFAFTLYLAFAFDVKSIATTRGGFSRHVPILVQEVLLKRGKSALIESSVSTPGCNVRVELRPGLNRRKEVVDSC